MANSQEVQPAEWAFFVTRVQAYCSKNTFSLPELEKCFASIQKEPFSSLSFFRKALISWGMCSFPKIRKFCLKPLFKIIQQKCIYAPRTAQEMYHRLVNTLFSEKEAIALRILLQKKEASRIVEKRSPVKEALQEFLARIENIDTEVKEVYVFPFISFIEKRLSEQGVEEEPLVRNIEAQKKQVSLLNNALKSEKAVMTEQVLPLIEELAMLPVNIYGGTLQQIESLLKKGYKEVLLHEVTLTPQMVQQNVTNIRSLFEKRLSTIKEMALESKKMMLELHDIQTFIKGYEHALHDLSRLKDLVSECVKEKEALARFATSCKALEKMEKETRDQEVSKRHTELLCLQGKATSEIAKLKKRGEELEIQCRLSKLRVQRRLFEIFSLITPYPDFLDTLEGCRKELLVKLQSFDRAWYSGKITSEEYEKSCNDFAYEHDVVFMRNELAFRATRLKELREKVRGLFEELQNMRRFLGMVLFTKELCKNIEVCAERCRTLLHRIEDPWNLFADCLDGEAVSIAFRKLWLEVEALQPQVKVLQEGFEETIPYHREECKKNFLKSLDCLEEVIRKESGARPLLVSSYERGLSSWEEIIRCIHEIESRYPFAKPFVFFMQIQDFYLRQKVFIEAKAQYEKIEALSHFAKSFQEIKTFEGGRINDILEVFESRNTIEETSGDDKEVCRAWEECRHFIRHALLLVEDEVLLDIGLMDRKGLMDIDEERLSHLMKYAASHAYKRITGSQDSLQEVLSFLKDSAGLYSTSSPYQLSKKLHKKIAHSLLSWVQVFQGEKFDFTYWKEAMQRFCEYQFLIKCMMATRTNDWVAHSFLLREEARIVVELVEAWLQHKRKNPNSSFSKPWILESVELRLLVEQGDTYEAKKYIESIFSKVESIPEVQAMGEEERKGLPLNDFKAELLEYGQKITHHKNEGAPYLFFYIPGNLRFFSTSR